jgi:hypothetical protein
VSRLSKRIQKKAHAATTPMMSTIIDNQVETTTIETGAMASANEENEEPKKETHDERQARLKAEARTFALSGDSSKKKKTTTKRALPVKRAATKAASYSSESSNSSISDFSDDDDNDDDDDNFGSNNKKRKVTQQEQPTGGGGISYTPQVVPQQMPMMYHQMSYAPPTPTSTQYMTVRVQVPYEELLAGRKMVVDLPNRLRLEVVIPPHILPVTIIPVQVPIVGDGGMMNNPYYSQQNNPPPQQQGQQQQKEQAGKEEISTTFWDQNWYNMFNLLVAYKKEHKTTNVSRRSHRKDTRLGLWVYQQLEEKKKKHKNMTKDKIQLLNSLDFDWYTTSRPPNTPWDEMYEKLAQYYRKYNTTKLTKKNLGEGENGGCVDTKLFQWIAGQRERYRKKNMPKNQIKLLNDIYFDFEYSLDNIWMKHYNNLIKYKEVHGGSTRVPKAYPELGHWVGNQRRRKMKLKKERIDLLDKIDFEWGNTK